MVKEGKPQNYLERARCTRTVFPCLDFANLLEVLVGELYLAVGGDSKLGNILGRQVKSSAEFVEQCTYSISIY